MLDQVSHIWYGIQVINYANTQSTHQKTAFAEKDQD